MKMGWILFLNEDEKPCAWPDESTMVGVSEKDEVYLECGKKKSFPAESHGHTNDWDQVLMWIENGPPEALEADVVEPGSDDEDEGDE